MILPQHIKTAEFRICLKELYADRHDPITVSYVVLAGICKKLLIFKTSSHYPEKGVSPGVFLTNVVQDERLIVKSSRFGDIVISLRRYP